MVQKINSNDFENLKNEFIVVDLYADWCGPCKMISPFIDEVSLELKEITFVKINVDENEDFAEKFDVHSIPTLIIFKDKEEVVRNTGFIMKNKLKEWIVNNCK